MGKIKSSRPVLDREVNEFGAAAKSVRMKPPQRNRGNDQGAQVAANAKILAKWSVPHAGTRHGWPFS
jgi:hypothetical protein